jgi:predicted nuclease of predicted toxin-antitoxin system
MKWLADENFPILSFKILLLEGWDIRHIALTEPSIDDADVMNRAIAEERIILTFDSDFGTLIFKKGYHPLGVVYFRLSGFSAGQPAQILLNLEKERILSFESYLTVISEEGIRQRAIT